jgi:type II secretory pathway component PulF
MLALTKLLYRVTILDKLVFTKHLGIMLKSGIPISEALFSLKDQTTNIAFRFVLDDIYSDVTNGKSLVKALSKHPEVFDNLYLSLIATGEKSGKLETNLEYLATALKRAFDFNKKIAGATLYPKIVLWATIIMGGSLSIFVLPHLSGLFTSLDIELPISTKILLFFSNTMKNYGLLIAGLLAILGILISLILKTTAVKPKWQSFLLDLPILGNMTRSFELTYICRNLGIMLKSGLTITSALETQHDATLNLVFKGYLKNLMKSVEKGKKISDELVAAKFKHIPIIAIKMIKVGEETGKLDEVLLYLGDFFEEESDDIAKNLSNTLEPILLLIIGLVVGFVAMAIISPIYQISGGIRK